jgi:hypothetical protein
MARRVKQVTAEVSFFTYDPAMRAWDRIQTFIAVGIGLAILAGFIIGAAWPGTETTECFNTWSGEDCSETEETGSMLWVIVGLFMAGVGQLLLLVGSIGWGVKLGTRAAAEV